MVKIGLKLWSINEQYVKSAVALYEQGFYEYIELFAVPGSFEKYANLWKSLNIPYIIHGPHFYQGGMCLSDVNAFAGNMKLAAEALRFADALDAQWVIFHSGVNGRIEEAARQFKSINDKRVLVENKPYIGLKDEFCNGYSPSEIRLIQEEAGVGFCLDIGHAIYAANSLKRSQADFLSEMVALKPKMFHLTGGYIESEKDYHLHLYEGSFNYELIQQILPISGNISLECPHDSQDNLDDFPKDSIFLRNLLTKNILSKNVSNSEIIHPE